MSSSSKKQSWLANQPLQRKMLIAICALLVVLLAASAANLLSLAREKETRAWSMHTYEVLVALADVENDAQSRQVAARGYLLNLSTSEYADLEKADTELTASLAKLRELTADNPLQQGRIDRLVEMLDRWEKEVMKGAIDPMREIGAASTPEASLARDAIRRTYLDRRTVLMTDVQALIADMTATENALLVQRNVALDDTLNLVRAFNIGSILVSLLFAGLVLAMTFRLITRPIVRMTELMTRLAAHDHNVDIRQLDRRDEIGQIARALHVFKEMAIDTAGQTWLKSGVSAISSKLQGATTYREFANVLTGELVPLLEAGVGVFYIWNDDSSTLELLGSYGYRQRRHATTGYAMGEGLIGQAAAERKTIVLQDVPDDYVRIHSGTGEAPPRSIVVIPVLSRDALLGVVEIGSFAHLTGVQEQLLDELMPIVALSLENLGRALRTRALLDTTQRQADELRTSEDALRAQQSDLQATNAELEIRTSELQEQSQRLVASEEELRVQAEELHASNEELREKGTTLNQQKDALEILQRDTQEKAEELARASQYKSDFLANMSHELRTPLNSLLILSRSLADNDENNLSGEQVESARIIHDAGSNLLRLINDILDLSKVEAGKMERVIDDFAIADLVRTLGRTFNHVAQEKKLGFTIDVEAGLPSTIRTDAAKLEQVTNNLLSNAFKFTSDGKVTVHIGRPSASLALPATLDRATAVAIAVTDTGIGIPKETFQRVFHAFEQVDASTSRQYGGTGLGLAISRRITELLGGDIVLASEPGKGSTFTIVIPEQATEDGTRPEPIPREQAAAEATLPLSPALIADSIDDDRATIVSGETTILIVEDDPAFARILADMVHRKGHRVLASADGESGLQLARQFQPTGILLDVMLPGMDGWTVIERLKGEPRTRHIPVHFISATDDATRGLELGAVGFLTKPVSREAISKAFERLLHFAEGRTRHLLVIDDDASARTAVRTLLRDDSVIIDEAASGEEALVMTADNTYDCIVLDLGLPGISGMDFLERLSKAGNVPPVVVYSGRDLSREESLKIRQYTDSIVVKGARSPDRLLDEVSLFLHSIRSGSRRADAGDAHQGEVGLNGRKVLLVDDDMRNLFALSKVLRAKGMNVVMAQDGQKALKAIDDDGSIELVLMDIMMPVMDGYETMREIRARPAVARIPIIALTAKAMRGDREKCLEAGANDYLSKPIDVDRLLSMIRVWLPS
ncbi:multi-sensor hybrid histidine kinase [Luteibacter rhizovicinus]|uniref:histidine kinase n=1 Tax=Luteibacter rhizovicinus TaxID=242606 RepID=A0A4R3YS32_9GAMM|nr:response regulator [Luteibacter rhizovicinus]TCV95707.1 multi-sensor hybrid histidine kinase [Luteibacter rhizovicinus]